MGCDRTMGREHYECEHGTMGCDRTMGREHYECEYSTMGRNCIVGCCYSAELNRAMGCNGTMGCNRTMGRFGSAGVLNAS